MTHLQNYFKDRGKNLYIDEPFLEGEEAQSQVLTVMVDDELMGQFYYLIDDYSLEVSLFFYSEEFSHKYFLLENELVEEIPFHTYYFWLGSLFAIYESYTEENKHKKKKKRRF